MKWLALMMLLVGCEQRPEDNTSDYEVSEAQLDSIKTDMNRLQEHLSLSENPSESFSKLQTVFTGNYPEQAIRHLVIPLMHRYDMVINNENVLRVGNVVYTLSRTSQKGVTEMNVLNSMFKMTEHSKQFSDDAAIIFNFLETNTR